MRDEDKTKEELLAELKWLREKCVLERGASRIEAEYGLRALEALLEYIPEGVTIIDFPEMVVKMVSSYGEKLAGRKRHELENIPFPEYYKRMGMRHASGTKPELDELPLKRAVKGDVIENEEWSLERPGGNPVFLVNSGPIRDRKGNIIGAVAAWRDITERMKISEELFKEKELHRKILEILPVGVFIIDEKGKITKTNSAVERIWGGAEYVGIEKYGMYKGWRTENGMPVEADDWAAAKAIKNGETIIDEEIEIETFDGKRKIILNSAMPIRDGDRITGAIAINHEITERKKIEEKLKESRIRLQEAQRIARLGNWEGCLEESTIKGSEEAYRILGLMPLEHITFDFAMGFVHPDDRKLLEHKLEQARTSAKPVEAEFRIILPDKSIKYVQTRSESIFRNGKAVKIIGTVQDVTERKLRENEREELVKELQKALTKVKTLSGLLPICASCKRIRDEKGSWKSVEKYVADHSEAEFSHSICPECEEKIYKKEMDQTVTGHFKTRQLGSVQNPPGSVFSFFTIFVLVFASSVF